MKYFFFHSLIVKVESRFQKVDILFKLLDQLRSGIVSSDDKEVTWRRLRKKVVKEKKMRKKFFLLRKSF